MSVEQLPNFTPDARKHWESVPADVRPKLLANVWCGKCRDAVTIKNFSGAMKGADLLLVGKCSVCQGDVARVIEGG